MLCVTSALGSILPNTASSLCGITYVARCASECPSVHSDVLDIGIGMQVQKFHARSCVKQRFENIRGVHRAATIHPYDSR